MRFRPTSRTFPISHSRSYFHDQYKFSTITLESTRSSRDPNDVLLAKNKIYDDLLQVCLRQCKNIQTRCLSDEKPQLATQALRTAKLIHANSLKFGIWSKGLLGNAIFDLYVKCAHLELAEQVFVRLDKRDVFAWNSVLSMYSRQGLLTQVVQSSASLRSCGVQPNEFTYAMVLSACARLGDIDYGRQLHSGVIQMGYELSSYCGGALIDMYAKCNCLSDARRIFDGAVDLDTVSWTAMIAGYVQVGLPEEAIRVFEEMQKVGNSPDQVAFVTVMNAFVALGRLADARELFAQMSSPNVVAWNVMISGHAQRGYEEEAMSFYLKMRESGVKSTRSTLASVLSASANLLALLIGTLVHAEAVKSGLNSNVYVGSSLLNMYAKCGKLDEAREVFDSLNERNVVLWNTMLGGYVQNGRTLEIVELFFHMKEIGPKADEYSYTSILSACACLENLEMGRQLHAQIIMSKSSSNLFVGNALIDMYAKSGSLKEARKQFEFMQNHDNISWNAIIVGYVQEEEEEEAFSMFRSMILDGVLPDEVSLASILSACANLQALEQGKQVHCLSIKANLETSIYAGSSLIDMYVKCGAIVDAHEVFACMPWWTVVSINALMAGYGQNNLEEAINLFHEMQAAGVKPTEITFTSLLDACSGAQMLSLGRQIHSLVLKWGLLYGSDILDISLLSMYINSQRKMDADILFSEFPNPKSTVLWTSIVSGFAQNDFSEQALQLYQEMRMENVLPDQATFASVLRACAVISSLRDGREIHSLILQTGFDLDELTCSALVDMYAKCGDVNSSIQVFNEMDIKDDVISWNSMIVGLAKNGCAERALETFEEMKQTNVVPDDITFLGVLNACSHAGRVLEGRHIFDIMVNHYGILPRKDHHACMVDLLGRWGFLKEAEEFIDRLNVEPDAMIWATFLGACRIHGEEARGQRAAKKLMELNPHNSSPYVLLSNIYAESGNWKSAVTLRREMEEIGVKKLPGCSWM